MKSYRKLFIGGLAVLTALSIAAVSPKAQAAPQPAVHIVLDGYPLPFPVEPVAIRGTTMVPFRAIAEALGIQVEWNQAAKRITATRKEGAGNKTVTLTLGNATASVDGQAVKLAVAPQTIAGSTMIPLSFFSSQFGATVSWNQATRTVSIVSPKREMYTLGFYAISAFSQYQLLPSFDAVAFGWSRIGRDGEFTLQGGDFYWPPAAGELTPERIVADAAQGGTAPYLMVNAVDGELELTRNLEDAALQERTLTSIVATATEKGFSGVMLDLEGLGLSGDIGKARSDFNRFVTALASKTRAAGLKLGLALHPLNSAYKGYDYETLGKLADELIIMAYAYGNEKTPEPTAQVDEAIKLALSHTAKEKLVLGISLASENEQSVAAKIGLAKRYGLKGIALWRIGIISQAEWKAMQGVIALPDQQQVVQP